MTHGYEELVKALRDSYGYSSQRDREAADAIEALVEAQRWIPVSERLPEQNGVNGSASCLIAIRYKYDLPDEKPSINIGYLLDDEWWSFMDNDCHEVGDGDEVTHWMPLPQPPKGERR